MDNIISVYEYLHFMKRKKAQDLRCCALKLDMRKAYDRVEWSYLRAIMLLFDGDHLEKFNPTRGMCQGDPISPYLFLLVAEGLSCVLKAGIQSSNLNGIKVAPTAPVVSHLLFEDDILLFFNVNRENAQEILDVLQVYCRASGNILMWTSRQFISLKGCPWPQEQRSRTCSTSRTKP
jgi:hypothetical protein